MFDKPAVAISRLFAAAGLFLQRTSAMSESCFTFVFAFILILHTSRYYIFHGDKST